LGGFASPPSCSLPRGKTQGKIFSRRALHQKVVSNQNLVCDLPIEIEGAAGKRQGNVSVGIAHRMLVVEKAYFGIDKIA
jgi:hypothetical protein